MARGKKKETALTPEEKLAQALVPEGDQPYKLPQNWCWTRLGELGYTNIGLTYKPSDVSPTGTIVLRSSNIQNGQMDYSDIVCVKMNIPESKMTQKGDILICARNGSKALVGKTAIVDRDGMSYGAFMAIFRSPYNSLIYYYLNSHYFRDIIDHDVGTTTINQVTQSLIKELPFPLPPLAEQKRIVARIESLFTKLDEAKEKAQSVVDSFETRKAAILHKAFTGELTAKWRAEHGVGKDEWLLPTLNDIAARIFDGPFGSNLKSDDYVNSGVRVVRLENLKNLWFDDSKQSFISEEKYEAIKKHTVYPSDLIMSTFIADETKVCQMPAYIAYAVNKADCIGIRLRGSVNTRYVLYYLSSKDVFYLLHKHIHGATRPRVNSRQIKAIPVPLANREEQNEIVRILDNLFAKEQQAKEAAEAVLEKIDLLKKSILARAFRGELGTNDPAEESALELLKRIL